MTRFYEDHKAFSEEVLTGEDTRETNELNQRLSLADYVHMFQLRGENAEFTIQATESGDTKWRTAVMLFKLPTTGRCWNTIMERIVDELQALYYLIDLEDELPC